MAGSDRMWDRGCEISHLASHSRGHKGPCDHASRQIPAMRMCFATLRRPPGERVPIVLTHTTCSARGVFPSPLRGGAGGGGHEIAAPTLRNSRPPSLTLPPRGEETDRVCCVCRVRQAE